MAKSFLDTISALWAEQKFLCVGLDSDLNQLPAKTNQLDFNKQIIDSTFDLVCAYKLNSAFYEAQGQSGLAALEQTVKYLKQKYPQITVILDAKRGDIGNTNEAYAKAIFDYLGVDATTVNPYLGKEALQPFLKRKDKGILVLVKTSNPGASEFQDLKVYDPERSRRVDGKPLYEVVAEHAVEWNENGNLGVVVGATYTEELSKVRKIVGNMPILIPGVGVQGGILEKTVKVAKNSQGAGMIINSSRGIIFASSGTDFAQKARYEALKLHKEIQKFLKL